MDEKPWKQPLYGSFVKEGQSQRDKEKQIEDPPDKAKAALEEDEEVIFKPRGKDYAKALQNQDPDKHALNPRKDTDKCAMDLQARGWGAAKHNEHTLQYDPDAKWEKSGGVREEEAWARKRKGEGYENR
ncbi:hypothetical protein AC578_10925 [Pseudocercospora eumusae]|uniref:Uncharacterized protein n=1 Tax=Pseudocercospora eumusae TaxID=321146 RepID=A0A139GVM2_9PEZI|nr:hypothetical protein AC578_10925 [Pseudocercospora eumusae]